MLMEGLVGVVALIAAASYADGHLLRHQRRSRDSAANFRNSWTRSTSTRQTAEARPAPRNGRPTICARSTWPRWKQMVGGESLRGRTGGAVTLAVGMALIFTEGAIAVDPARTRVASMKYWYHFAIMFEALFILTTIDTGTRIARFLLQETLGQILAAVRQDRLAARLDPGDGGRHGGLGHSRLHRLDRHDLADVRHRQSTAGRHGLGLVTTLLVNSGKGRYAPVTLCRCSSSRQRR